ncbi:MAG: endolytic transglycosylase MltG [Peptococcaceae bacterium]
MIFKRGLRSIKKPSLILKCFLAGLVLAIFLSVLYVNALVNPVFPASKNKLITVIIPPRASSAAVGKILYEHGLVRAPLVFQVYSRLKGVDGKLKTGRYYFSLKQGVPEITAQLVKGPDAVVFTIPEGFTVYQIADLLDRRGLVEKEAFLKAAAAANFNYSFLTYLPLSWRRLEGYLFPDTYRVNHGTSAQKIIEMMLDRFNRTVKKLNYEKQARQAGLTLHQAVIIASLVEREAKKEDERPLIAGVIMNRLQKRMPLQVDATVQYALGSQRAKLYYKDLQVDSPYNTYKIPGLPPGPIACPGESSLLAAVKPSPTSYLYYVAKPDGSHAFASTLAAHNINRKRYLPIEK